MPCLSSLGYKCSNPVKKLNLRTLFDSVSMSLIANGQRSSDTQGEEGWKEGSKGLYLQQSTCEKDGSTPREKRGCIIVNIENANGIKPFVLYNIKTTEEVRAELFDRFPYMNSNKILVQCFPSRMGTLGRKSLEGEIPAIEEIWVTLYLRKH